MLLGPGLRLVQHTLAYNDGHARGPVGTNHRRQRRSLGLYNSHDGRRQLLLLRSQRPALRLAVRPKEPQLPASPRCFRRPVIQASKSLARTDNDAHTPHHRRPVDFHPSGDLRTRPSYSPAPFCLPLHLAPAILVHVLHVRGRLVPVPSRSPWL
ncbi:hypothetical protein K438DRAFT_1977576 [Mycena galopus ATCC 62051]|nr:hypothetical protein K438DRAFT_1977576 [Mycena galopus ATCC 62051]